MSSEDLDLIHEWIRRWRAGEPLADLVAPDYRGSGEPTPFHEVEGRTADERRASIQSDVDVTFRDVVDGTQGRVVFEAVWSHDLPNGQAGSAGLFWGVAQVERRRIRSVAYYQDPGAARRAAGLL